MSQQTEKPQGRLYAIGTGPGASDLITVRGARIISELDILYAPAGKKDAPSLAHTIVAPYITGKTTVKTYHFLMKAPQEAKEAVWDDVAKAIQEDVADGKKVGFIGIGTSNLPLIKLFSDKGAAVSAYDKKDFESLGENAVKAKEYGAVNNLN